MALSQTRHTQEVGNNMSSLRTLRAARNRDLLRLLIPEDDPIPMVVLARRLAAHERGKPVSKVDASAISDIEADFCQARLPNLHKANLVEWRPGPGVVDTTERVFEDRRVRLVLQLQSDADADSVIRTLTSPRRRAVLNHLNQTNSEVTCSELATHLVDSNDESVDVELLDASLHHTTLHELDDAELIDYNASTETASLTPKGQTVCKFTNSLS